MRRYSWHYEYALQLAPMREALGYIVGEHDFSAFRAAGGAPGMSPVRTLYEADCHQEKTCIYFIFGVTVLYHMVRNIVGTVVKVGNGKLSPLQFREILRGRDRNKAGKTAPAKGLVLWQVNY